MTESELQGVLDWTKEKLATGEEPPWAWFQYMKLQENLEAIINSINSSKLQMASSQQSEKPLEKHLQLVDSTYQQDISQHRPSDEMVQLPM